MSLKYTVLFHGENVDLKYTRMLYYEQEICVNDGWGVKRLYYYW